MTPGHLIVASGSQQCIKVDGDTIHLSMSTVHTEFVKLHLTNAGKLKKVIVAAAVRWHLWSLIQPALQEKAVSHARLSPLAMRSAIV